MDDPEYAVVADRLRELLDEHIITVNDNGFIPEGSPLEGWGPSRAEGAYPIAEATALAASAIRRRSENLPALVDALDHDSEILRFRGARGLAMLKEACAPARDALLPAFADPSPRVQMAAAWAALYTGEIDAAACLLISRLGADQPWQVRLQALNALTYGPRPMREALEAVEALFDNDQQYVRGAARYLRLVLRDEYTPDAKNVFDLGRFMAQMRAAP